MDRRNFLHVALAGAAGTALIDTAAGQALPLGGDAPPDNERLIDIIKFTLDGVDWLARESIDQRGGAIVLVGGGQTIRLTKRTEACFAEADQPYLGLQLRDIAEADADLLADKLLAHGGDPDPELVRRAVPPVGSSFDPARIGMRLPWTSFIGTRQATDTMPVFADGRTQTYRPDLDFPELAKDPAARTRFDGMLGGWLPVVHRVIPAGNNRWFDLIVFADTDFAGPQIVHSWHRTMLIENGKPSKIVYGNSYPATGPRRATVKASAFYGALMRMAAAWQRDLSDLSPLTTPDPKLADMTTHAFARELTARGGGTYPKYGAVDRSYAGAEHDGLQEVFTASLSANLEWGRFTQAKAVLDDYFDRVVGTDGTVDTRAQLVPQFGATLSAIARYILLTGDTATVERHRAKISATAQLLVELHDTAQKLPGSDRGQGLLSGWSDAAAYGQADPALVAKPYWNNSALAIRGWRDLARMWPLVGPESEAETWRKRADTLQEKLVSKLSGAVRKDLTPAYLAPLPGVGNTLREELARGGPTEQAWSHRVFAELLGADVTPLDLTGTIVDSLRGHGGTSIGATGTAVAPADGGRPLFGPAAAGHALALLRLDRVEQFLLFLHAYRFHAHRPGSWLAGESSGINGELPLFCTPAQMTLPLLIKAMLVLEDSDAGRLHLGRAIPRAWMGSGQMIALRQTPTRWGRLDYATQLTGKAGVAELNFEKPGPAETRVRFRTPDNRFLASAKINGKPAPIQGEEVVFDTRAGGSFKIEATVS